MPIRPEDPVADFPHVRAVDETDKSVKCIIPGHGKGGTDAITYVPKSQISADSEVWKNGDEGVLVVSQWWAETAKLV